MNEDSFSVFEAKDFNPLTENPDNSLNISSISNEIEIKNQPKIVIEQEKEDEIQIDFDSTKKQNKTRSKRKKEDLDKTPLYIFDCIYCVKGGIFQKYILFERLSEKYQEMISKKQYEDITSICKINQIKDPNKTIVNKNIKIQNYFENLREFYEIKTSHEKFESINKNVVFKPRIFRNHKIRKLSFLFPERIPNIEDYTNITNKKDFINNTFENIFDKIDPTFNQTNNEIPIISNDLDGNNNFMNENSFNKLDNNLSKFKEISFESIENDIYNPKFSSGGSRDVSMDMSNFCSNLLINSSKINNKINLNMNSAYEMIYSENLNKSDNNVNQNDNSYKNSTSFNYCYSNFDKFSFHSNSILCNISEIKNSNLNEIKVNNSNILINDRNKPFIDKPRKLISSSNLEKLKFLKAPEISKTPKNKFNPHETSLNENKGFLISKKKSVQMNFKIKTPQTVPSKAININVNERKKNHVRFSMNVQETKKNQSKTIIEERASRDIQKKKLTEQTHNFDEIHLGNRNLKSKGKLPLKSITHGLNSFTKIPDFSEKTSQFNLSPIQFKETNKKPKFGHTEFPDSSHFKNEKLPEFKFSVKTLSSIDQ